MMNGEVMLTVAERLRLRAKSENLGVMTGGLDHEASDLIDALTEALKGITPGLPPKDAPCHVGICVREKCRHCGAIIEARAALALAEVRQ